MIRIQLRYAKPHMHLSRALVGPDGRLVAGAGTTLNAVVVRALMRFGFDSVEVTEGEEVQDWEQDKAVEQALADLEARFASEPAEPTLDAVKQALRRHLVARADRPRQGTS
jgi:hypothetical protein